MTTLAPATRSATARARDRSQPKPLAGLPKLLRFMVRRDRVRMTVWVVGIIAVVIFGSDAAISLYSTPTELANYAELAQADKALHAISGPGYGLDEPTQGAVAMNEMSMFTFIAVALMAIFIMIRHTRAEEDTDRAELVRAAPVGRDAALVSSSIWTSAACALIGVGIAIGMTFVGLEGTGSAAFGAATAMTGILFVGISAAAAQVASTARAARTLAGSTLGAFFVIRAVGDLGNGWMTWLSPLGWAQAIRAYADERWWVLVLLLAATLVAFAAAFALSARRDVGHGILAQRPGPERAHAWLSSPTALAFRLQRASIIGWATGIGIMAFFFGIVADQADALAENEAIAEMFALVGGGSITDAFLATIVTMTGLMATGFTASAVLRLRSEEVARRVEPMLATPVGRPKWMMSHLLMSLVGTVVVMFVAGLLVGLGYAVQVGDGDKILPVLGAAIATVPAMWVIAGLGAALVGIVPRLSILVWAAVAWVLLVGMLGESLNLPQWARNLSPFEHVPALPAADCDAAPVLVLLAISAFLTIIGLVGIRIRDF